MAMAQGTSESMVKISGEMLRQLRVPDVPVAEQRRIVGVLNSLTELERSLEAEIRKLELIGASAVKRRLDDLYDASGLLTLADVASVERGKFSARPRNDPAYFGAGYGFIQAGDVSAGRRGVIRRSSQRLNDAGLAVSRLFPAGTVVVTIAATIGETAILGKPMCFPDSVVGVVANDGFDSRFLELCLHRAKSDLEGRAPQSAQRNINLQDLRPLAVPSISRSSQAALVSLWETYRNQVAAMQDELAKLRRLKQGLVDDLLSGRVAVSALAGLSERRPALAVGRGPDESWWGAVQWGSFRQAALAAATSCARGASSRTELAFGCRRSAALIVRKWSSPRLDETCSYSSRNRDQLSQAASR